MKTKNNLEPKQEQYITMLIAGQSLTSISEAIGVNRSTLYTWRDLETVQARYNELTAEIKSTVEAGLIGMYSEAIEAVRSCLKSENDQVKLKTALWLIDRAGDLQPGITDPEQIVRENYTKTIGPFDDLEAFKDKDELDQTGYTRRMKELGLKAS